MDETAILPLHKTTGMTTRGHSLKLQKRESKGQLRANFFGLRVVNIWNALPNVIVTAESVNCFKGRFDRWNGGSKFCMSPADIVEKRTGSTSMENDN